MTDDKAIKVCSCCKEPHSIDLFGVAPNYADGRRGQCNACRSLLNIKRYKSSQKVRDAAKRKRREHYKANKDADRWRHRLRKYGITRDAYEDLLKAQDGCCAICKTDNPKSSFGDFCVDHCHTTGKVRGLLCPSCNTAIGALGDNAKGVKRALEYLLKA